MCRHLLRPREQTAVEQVDGDSSRAEYVTAKLGDDTRRFRGQPGAG
jgi:hypothetical protein